VKKHFVAIMGNEMYIYKAKGQDSHDRMHSLKGAFIVEEADNKKESSVFSIRIEYSQHDKIDLIFEDQK